MICNIDIEDSHLKLIYILVQHNIITFMFVLEMHDSIPPLMTSHFCLGKFACRFDWGL